ncbi:hemerythrin domain-containing protein [Sphingomonas sp. 2R-10]|uniref:hemerythrin domain-containing protein n=1 Tax=Sphingomonas sp. 2R-10 TaxID=3045148 RepID=UPI0019D120EE|nr:hemerythrin domain-containing protein [Sphingomonas sp. 2R-10]MDJ0278636.1 hemerythrin domain-containing protein [Sphingomonas sp. 2R-10]
MSDPFALDTRDGIPDDIAYLRARHHQGDWAAHANFGQLCDFWLHVHRSLRSEGAAMEAIIADLREGRLDPQRFPQRFVPALNQFLGHLDGHHRIEDGVYFPRFRALDPRMARGFDLLEADHHAIHDALEATVGSARGLLASLTDARAAETHAAAAATLTRLLLRHLADEEDLVIPAMLEHGERRVG